MLPTRFPSVSCLQADMDVYRPSAIVVQAWHPASMARQSWPQASATLLMAFMTPLLCVVLERGLRQRRHGLQESADDGQTVLVGSIRSHFFRCEDGSHSRQSVACKVGKDAEMCTPTRQASSRGATRSAMVLTALAPMASRQSTSR